MSDSCTAGQTFNESTCACVTALLYFDSASCRRLVPSDFGTITEITIEYHVEPPSAGPPPTAEINGYYAGGSYCDSVTGGVLSLGGATSLGGTVVVERARDCDSWILVGNGNSVGPITCHL